MLPPWFTRALSRVRHDAFYRQAALYMTASLVTSVLNYLYYPIMARLVGVSDYGELQIVTSFLLQLTTVFVGMNLISINIVANRDESEAKTLMVALQKIVFWLIVAVSVVVLVLSGLLQHFFHFTSPWPFIFIIPSLLVDALAVFWTAYLQAHRDFRSLSVYAILTGVGKIVFSVGLVWLGFGVAGGILGIALGLFGSLLAVRLITKHQLPPMRQTITWPRKHELQLVRAHIGYVVMVVVALVSMSVLLSIDTILVKHLFSPHVAGQYAGVSTVARILFYACAPLVSVMLPAIIIKEVAASRAAFRRTIVLSVLVGIAGLIVFALIPTFLLRVFLGAQFTAQAHWLPLLGIIAVLVTFTNVMVNYLLALRSRLAIVLSLTSLLAAVGLISWHHRTIPQIIAGVCIGLLAGQALFWIAVITRGGALGEAAADNTPS